MAKTIAVAYGDGIGAEITDSTLKIIGYANAGIQAEYVELGHEAYKKGYESGVPDYSIDTMKRTGVLLKGPIMTPQGGGYKSVNVTLRKMFDMYINVRRCKSYPFVQSLHQGVDMVIVRENSEDLYCGIEYEMHEGYMCAMKFISRSASERICRFAFEYAKRNNRRKVTCITKDNILKKTDGLFHNVFDEIAKEYPEIVANHYIVDIGAAHIAANPGIVDVVVTQNLYGDILSDIAAQVTGSVGMGSSLNIGSEIAMFEAVHGSAPDIAGKGIANPSGLLSAAIEMLIYLQEREAAQRIYSAWIDTLNDGLHTGDIFRANFSQQRCTTQEFTDAIISRMTHQTKVIVGYNNNLPKAQSPIATSSDKTNKTIGIDIYIHWNDTLGSLLVPLQQIQCNLKLRKISKEGCEVSPDNDSIIRGILCCSVAPTNLGDAITDLDIETLIIQLHKQSIKFTGIMKIMYSHTDTESNIDE